jgi:hypothetical protein
MVDLVDPMTGDRVGDGIDQLGQSILWLDQLDGGGLLSGPERLPSPAMRILVFGEELVKHLWEVRKLPAFVDDHAVARDLDHGPALVAAGRTPGRFLTRSGSESSNTPRFRKARPPASEFFNADQLQIHRTFHSCRPSCHAFVRGHQREG